MILKEGAVTNLQELREFFSLQTSEYIPLMGIGLVENERMIGELKVSMHAWYLKF